METKILGLAISNRQNASLEVQNLLTKYGCSIKTRLGMHEVNENACSTSGLIILELTGDQEEYQRLERDLRLIQGIQVDSMSFNLNN